MKTAELSGAALDWAVAKADGRAVRKMHGRWVEEFELEKGIDFAPIPNFHRVWAIAGEIIEREKICIAAKSEGDVMPDEWTAALRDGPYWFGPTALVAAMRCFASKLGDEIELPKEFA